MRIVITKPFISDKPVCISVALFKVLLFSQESIILDSVEVIFVHDKVESLVGYGETVTCIRKKSGREHPH